MAHALQPCRINVAANSHLLLERDPDADTASRNYADLPRLVTTCLEVGSSTQRDTIPESQVTRFGIADTQITVVVGKTESSASGHFVSLDIVPIGLKSFPAP